MANGSDGSIVIDTTLDSSGFEAGSRQMLAAAGRLTQQVTAQGRTLQQNLSAIMRSASSLGSSLSRISDSANAGFANENQIDRFATSLDRAKEKLAEIEAEMAQVAVQQTPTEEYSALERELDKAYQKYGTLQQRMEMMQALGVDENTNSYKRLTMQLEEAKADLDALRNAQQDMISSGQAYTSGKDSEPYAALSQQLQAYKAAIAEFEQTEANARAELDQETAAEERNVSSKERATQSTKKATQHNHLLASALKAVSKAAQRIPGAASVMVGGLKKFLMISKKSTNSTAGLIKGLTGLGRMLKTRIKRMFISEIFKSLGVGIHNLAKYSSAFNASMSAMKNSMTGLSGNIAVAAGNLVNTFAPAISTIIDWISKAISYLNAFFALIQGKGTFTRAKTATDDYAKSLKSAGGAANDLKNQVYGFDELNKEQDTSGGGGGGGGSGPEFEDVGIDSVLPENITNLFNSIKEAFLAGEWNQIGFLIGDALNGVVTAVNDWVTGTLEPAAVTWSSRIAQILNGLASGINWANLGTLFANGLNTITHTINTFVSTFDWVSLGIKLAHGANALVEGIDWVALGATLVAKAKVLWDTLFGFVLNFDWANLGSSVATGANSAFNSINWTDIATTLGTTIMRLWTAITTAISQFDWETVGATLAAAVNTLFAAEEGPIDWAAAGESLSTALTTLIDGISTFLTTVNWQQIGTDVATFLAAIDWSGLVTSLVTAIGAALGGLTELLTGLISPAWEGVKTWWEGIMTANGGDIWAALLSGLVSAVTGMGEWLMTNVVTPFVNGFRSALGLDAVTSSDIYKFGSDIWDSFTQGITNAWSAVTTWVKTNITDPFVNAIKSFFGIASPSTVMDEIGGFLITGLQNGITTAWTTLTSWFDTALSGITTAISDTWTNITTAASTAWEGIKTTVTGLWDGMSSAIDTGISTLKTNLSTAWTDISTTASTWWSSISTTVSSLATTLWTNVTTTASTLGTDLSTAWEGMKTTASTAWQGVKTTVVGWWDSLVKAVKGEDWNSVGKGAVDGTESGIKNNWSTFKSRVTGWFGGLVSGVKSALGIHSPSTVFAEIGDYCMQGLDEGFKAEEDTVTRTVAGIAEAVNDSMDIDSSGASIGTALSDGLDVVADKLSGVVEMFAAIADSITNMGGLTVPSIATGSVIPYQSRVGANGVEATPGAGVDRFTENFDETMTDQLDVLQNILRAIQGLDLTVDGNSLTRAITSLQRANLRAYGGV